MYIYWGFAMKKNILLFTFFLSLNLLLQEEALAVQSGAKFITRFSFRQFYGGVIIVKALLDDYPDSLNFIMDTGSGGISLDSATCSRLNISCVPSDTTVNGIGGTRKVCFAFNQTLRFPGLNVNKLDFHINDYSLLTSVYGEKIDGVIGYSFLSRYIIKVDFDSLQIDVYSPGKITYPYGGSLLRPYLSTIPIQSLRVSDARRVKSRFYFDTGAGMCFLMSERFKKDSNVLSVYHNPVTTEAQGIGGHITMQLTTIKQIQIGRFKFKSVPTYIYDDENNVTEYPYSGGLIGNDLLYRFNFILNYPADEIYILPNSHFLDPFDYAYTGMSIYYEDGQIIVDDIIPNSPATLAGIKDGDILLGVDDNKSNNVQQYRNILESPKEKIKLFINRNGQMLELLIKPKVIS